MHDVAFVSPEFSIVSEQHFRCPVPGQHVPAAAEHIGGLAGQARQHAPQRLLDLLGAGWARFRRRPIIQDEEMPPFGCVELEGIGQRR
jgi:hypothetical protein